MTETNLQEIEAQAIDSPSPWAKNHIDQYLATDGAAVDHPSAERLILLYTTGRRSGRIRRTPVVHFPAGDDMLVVASKGGAPTHPAWYLNLVADPQVWIRFKDEFFPAIASTLDPDERALEWAKITAMSPGFADYEAKTDRVIPVVRLTAL
ncbi:MAG TPA: nitroreductase family deazaflavin-dependent oxidoreductase [Acidimicrobiia bacterium]|nr:nitroreductase family deazaflavin-dependent oxidoreductase [Acidimicrobiia bacterium]